VKLYRNAVIAFSATFVALGISLIVVTALKGGGSGYLIGVLFIGLGLGRSWLALRRRGQ
jgi:hypothetical protein